MTPGATATGRNMGTVPSRPDRDDGLRRQGTLTAGMGAVARSTKWGCCCPRMTRSAANITNRIASPRILRKYYGSHIADVKRFTMSTTHLPTTHPPPFAPEAG